MKFNSGQYNCLEIFVKSIQEEQGEVSLTNLSTSESSTIKSGIVNYKLVKFNLEKETEYQLSLLNAKSSIAYLSGHENILDTGVKFIEVKNNEMLEIKDELASWYDTPYREQYHFGPYKNWINDPNGLCFYKGYYHLFYQANPHSQEWSHMHWGHAVSKDLIHWTHLPYVLFPQDEILESNELKGGAFSGSAVALDNRIQFYLTRHIGPLEDCDETNQYQTMVSSVDGVTFEEEKIIIEKPGSPFSFNFRDPKVFYHDEKWKMVLGTQINDIPAIVMYESDDMENFIYTGEVLTESKEGVYTIECPDLFELNHQFVAVAAYMFYTDEYQRIQPTMYYIGDLKGHRLDVHNKGLFDFGSNFYAVQTFEHENRRIAIGWVSDFYHEHVIEENGAYGSMALPRELQVINQHLYMKPVKEVYDLKDKLLYKGSKENVLLNSIEGNTYYAKIKINGDSDFYFILGRSQQGSIRLQRKNQITSIETEGVKSSHASFVTDVLDVKSLEVFVDRRVVEVFINEGEAAGTKLFYTERKDGIFEAVFADVDAVEEISVYTMKSIW